jgi:hypothetical protein
MSLPEVQREEVIAERESFKATLDQKRQLDNMFNNRQGEDTVANAAKRELSRISTCPPSASSL